MDSPDTRPSYTIASSTARDGYWVTIDEAVNIAFPETNFDRWMDVTDDTETLMEFFDQIHEMDYGIRESEDISCRDLEE